MFMAENYDRLHFLLNQYANKKTSQVEENELFDLLSRTENKEIEPMLTAILEQTSPMPDAERRDRILRNVLAAPGQKELQGKGGQMRRMWHRWAVAASVLLLLALGGYFLFFNEPAKQDEIVKREPVKDIEAPKGTKAMITLVNGERVLLDSITNGTLATQGNVNVIKTADGRIVYSPETGVVSKEIEYNTMFNPRGSLAVPLTLIDGTIVWLNSESSLRYFTSVGNGERRVEITGECYFEVAPDAARPFIVKDVKRGAEVQVLGTAFNVNTYTDEPVMKVTLLEGSVKVSTVHSPQSTVIKPGEQAQVNNNIKVVGNVDIEQVVAWKNGMFKMTSADIGTIMRQLARWYDVEVIYEGAIPKGTISGEVPRNLNLSEVLKVYEYSGVKFRIEGRKIVVM